MSITSRSYSQRFVGQKTMSVYGGAGGYGTRISTPPIGHSYYSSRGLNLTDGLDLHVDANEKAMLQNLNDRLASYLEKVHKLEKENERLDKQIKEWYTSKTVITHDYSAYLATIADLQDKVRAASTSNAKIYLEIDNSKLAAEDFKMKYENELSMRHAVDSDIAGLRKVLDDLNLNRMDLESEYESLKDELIFLKKNHEEVCCIWKLDDGSSKGVELETLVYTLFKDNRTKLRSIQEMTLLKTQMGGQVNVEIDGPSPIDLNLVMKEIRENYEALISKKRKELELWYQNKITVVGKEAEEHSTSLEASRLEIKELKSTLQTLQIEHQSHLSMKSSLEATLREVHERYSTKLVGLQSMVTGLEAQMTLLTTSINENNLKYGTLLDLKTRLEAEIVEYRRLLDGEDDRSYSQRFVGQKTMSVYGGAGGYGTRISTPPIGHSYYSSRGLNLTDGLDLHVDANEKAMLQNLNDRLASYLEKVHKLEKENERLDKQIKEWYTSKTVITHEYSAYLATIADLQDKVRAASTSNAKIYLEIDNSKLAAEDFKMKYENELSMRHAVDIDIAGLRKVLDDLNLNRMDLESEYETLKDELISLKKNHEEILALLRAQMSGQVNVEVDAPSPVDLNQIMTEIREHYEGVIAKNRKELELWYQNKITVVKKDAEVHSTSLEASRLEIKELKSTLQRLQIELQSHLSMKSSLEATLRETQEGYSAQLAGLQSMVTGLETQMTLLTASINENNLKYGTLLDLKTRLEAEIVEYRRLLDGEDDRGSSKQVITKTIVVQETYVDGKKVDSSKR